MSRTGSLQPTTTLQNLRDALATTRAPTFSQRPDSAEWENYGDHVREVSRLMAEWVEATANTINHHGSGHQIASRFVREVAFEWLTDETLSAIKDHASDARDAGRGKSPRPLAIAAE